MSTTISMQKQELILAPNERAFTETLFRPVDGRTADGYVIKRGKRYVDVWICGKVFRVNRWLVLCERGESGAWFHGCLSVPFTLGAMRDAFAALAVGSEWQDGEIAYRFAA